MRASFQAVCWKGNKAICLAVQCCVARLKEYATHDMNHSHGVVQAASSGNKLMFLLKILKTLVVN